MRIAFLTATPLNVLQGSGTFAGVATLAAALRRLGHDVEIIPPRFRFPVFTAGRLFYNWHLRARRWTGFDLVVGFDLDGFTVAGRAGCPHIASIKGVIADEMRFERGLTRLTMAVQAAFEARHVRRADLVITTSNYAAARIRELYRLPERPSIVPEAIDLSAWQSLFLRNPAQPDPAGFTVLTVCRFYPRKRLHLLLAAAVELRRQIPGLEFRIVGNGPERGRLLSMWRANRLQGTVKWLGDLSQEALAREYNACDVFCLPSVQEGFGIVFLEAMAAGKPVVAARAAAAPEVLPHGLLVEPDNARAVAEAILRLHRDPDLRSSLAEEGARRVLRYDARPVAETFLAESSRLLK